LTKNRSSLSHQFNFVLIIERNFVLFCYQNNYVQKTEIWWATLQKHFSNLRVLYIYFNNPTKLFSRTLTKFLDTIIKSFFLCRTDRTICTHELFYEKLDFILLIQNFKYAYIIKANNSVLFVYSAVQSFGSSWSTSRLLFYNAIHTHILLLSEKLYHTPFNFRPIHLITTI